MVSKYYDVPYNIKDPNSIPWQYFILTRRREKMPNSLKCKIKHLCHNRTITESECDRILKALEKEEKESTIMTNYDKYIQLLQTNKSKLASILCSSCSCCPRKFRTDCFSADNVDKSCYTMVLEWLNTETQDEEEF